MILLLKEQRERAGLSQAELAKKSGVSQQKISALETGIRSNLPVDMCYKLASALGCRFDDLLKLDE